MFSQWCISPLSVCISGGWGESKRKRTQHLFSKPRSSPQRPFPPFHPSLPLPSSLFFPSLIALFLPSLLSRPSSPLFFPSIISVLLPPSVIASVCVFSQRECGGSGCSHTLALQHESLPAPSSPQNQEGVPHTHTHTHTSQREDSHTSLYSHRAHLISHYNPKVNIALCERTHTHQGF